jgi:Leucine-rich repeat (LRR) protein
MPQELSHSRWGTRIVVSGPWTDADTKLAQETEVRHLVLNYMNGWDNRIDFLPELPALRYIEIMSISLNDLSPLENLRQLEGLRMTAVKAKRFSLAELRQLTELSISWKPGYRDIEACEKLENIWISHWAWEDLSPLRLMKKLQKLRIATGRLRRFSPVTHKKLQALGLYLLKNLEDIEEFSELVALQHLELKGKSRVKSYEAIGRISSLRTLKLENIPVKNLAFVRSLALLEDFRYYEGIIEDGDLSPLDSLQKLRCVRFQDRRHYNRRFEDYPKDCKRPVIWVDEQTLAEVKAMRTLDWPKERE